MTLTRKQLAIIHARNAGVPTKDIIKGFSERDDSSMAKDIQKEINENIAKDVELHERGIKPMSPSLQKFLKATAERRAREERTGIKERTFTFNEIGDILEKARKRKEEERRRKGFGIN